MQRPIWLEILTYAAIGATVGGIIGLIIGWIS